MSIDNPKVISFEKWFENNYPNQGECDYCECGKVQCEACDGDGYAECNDCVEDDNGELICSKCQGGYIECEWCKGDGVVDCEECLGTNINNYCDIELEYLDRLKKDLKKYKEVMKNNG